MRFDYSKLKGKIVEVYGSQKAFAKALGVSEHTMSVRLNNKKAWTYQEIIKTVELLKLSPFELSQCFFTPEVEQEVTVME